MVIWDSNGILWHCDPMLFCEDLLNKLNRIFWLLTMHSLMISLKCCVLVSWQLKPIT